MPNEISPKKDDWYEKVLDAQTELSLIAEKVGNLDIIDGEILLLKRKNTEKELITEGENIVKDLREHFAKFLIVVHELHYSQKIDPEEAFQRMTFQIEFVKALVKKLEDWRTKVK